MEETGMNYQYAGVIKQLKPKVDMGILFEYIKNRFSIECVEFICAIINGDEVYEYKLTADSPITPKFIMLFEALLTEVNDTVVIKPSFILFINFKKEYGQHEDFYMHT